MDIWEAISTEAERWTSDGKYESFNLYKVVMSEILTSEIRCSHDQNLAHV